MRILYAIQGTGNGHLARATEIVPILKKFADIDVLVSGIQGDLNLPFEVKYQLYGLSFIFGQKGGISLSKTFTKARLHLIARDIFQVPVQEYDLVMNDFEPITAWACQLKRVECIGISHQNAVLHPIAPRPAKVDKVAETFMKLYAPSHRKIGFHFLALDESNYTPVIRSSIYQAKPTKGNHYTVYLPSYSDKEIIQVLSKFKDVQWEVFSKHTHKHYSVKNIKLQPVSLDGFTNSFVNCRGILCNAGFETPAEAIFMGKNLCVIPMKNQYEQACNAEFLHHLDVSVLSSLKNDTEKIKDWLQEKNVVQINYANQTEKIIRDIIIYATTKMVQPVGYTQRMNVFRNLKRFLN